MAGEFADAGSIRATIEFDADAAQASVDRAMRAAMPVVVRNADEIGEAVETSLTSKFKSMGKNLMGALGIGIGVDSLVQVGGYIASIGRETEKALNMFAAVSGASATQMEAVSEQAQALGTDASLAGVSAGDAALAMTELAKSGFSVEESMDGATGVLQLATAAQTDAASAATIAAAQIQAFGLEASDSAMVADVLANAANITSADMEGMADSLNQVGAVAKASGLSFAETAGTVALMADNAIIGSDAGTSLKSMLLAIQAPSEKAAGVMADLGINMYDNNGKMLSLAEMTAELTEGTKGLTDEQRQQALATIFGADAIRTVNVLMNEGAQEVQNLTDAVQEQGAAAELADANTKGFTGAIDALRNVADGLAGDIYQNVAPALEDGLRSVLEDLPGIIEGAKAYVSDFLDALEPAGRIIKSMLDAMTPGVIMAFKAALGAALGVVKLLGVVLEPIAGLLEANEGAMGGIIQTATAVVVGYKLMTGAVRRFNTVMSSEKVTTYRTNLRNLSGSLHSVSGATSVARRGFRNMSAALGGPWGIAIGVATAAIGFFAGKQAEAKARVAEFTGTLDEQTQAFTKNTEEAVARMLVEDEGWDTDRLEQYGLTLQDVTDAVMNGGSALEDIQSKLRGSEELLGNASLGFLKDIDLPGLTDSANDYASSLGHMSDQLHQAQENEALLTEETIGGAEALRQLLGPTGATREATGNLADSFREQADAADEAKTAVWGLQNQFIKGLGAEIEYEAAIDDLAAQIKDVGKKALTASGELKIGSEKGRALGQALISVANSAKGAKGGIKAAREEVIKVLTPLLGGKKAARNMANEFFVLKGKAKGAADDTRNLDDALTKLPKKVQTFLKQHGYDLSKKQIDNLQKEYELTPEQVETLLEVLGAAEATGKVNNLQAAIERLHDRTVTITTHYKTVRSVTDALPDRTPRATGGPIFGGGTGTSDDVPVAASVGEHMWTAREVDAVGGHKAMLNLRRAALSGDLSLATGGDARGEAPLVENLSLSVGSKDDLDDGLNATLFHLRRIKRGSGRHVKG